MRTDDQRLPEESGDKKPAEDAAARRSRKAEVAWMKSAYQIIRKPVITEKGLGH